MTEDEPKNTAELLKMWQGRVKFAEKFQEEFGNQAPSTPMGKRRWDENVRALAGDFNSTGDDIDVNVVRASNKIKLPPLKLVRPKVNVNPTAKEHVRASEYTTIEINYWLNELNVRHQMSKALTDCMATNCGYLYLGITEKKADGYDASGTRMENRPEVRSGQPFVRRVSPKQVLVPPGFWDLEDAPWVDIVFCMPLRHVVKKFKIPAEDIVTTNKIDLSFDERDSTLKAYADSEDVKMVDVHNVWDKETQKVYIFAKDMDRFMEEPSDWPVEVEGFPVVHLRPELISDQYYGTPPTTYIMPQQRELNKARTSTARRFGKSKATIFVSSDVSEQVIEEYKKNPDGGIIRTGIDGDVRQHIMIDQGLPMDGHGIGYAQVIKSDIIEQDGQSAEQRGGGDPNIDSATASANIQRNLNIRSSELADMVRSAYLEVAKKLWMMIAGRPSVSVIRRVQGPQAGIFTDVRYTTKELRGEFRFDMDFSAKVPDTDTEKVQKSMLKYKLFRADPLVNAKKLILDVHLALGELNPEEALEFLRSPDEEHKMFMSGLQAEAHERDDHQSHLPDHDQFVIQIDQQLEQAQEGTPQHGKLQVAQILAVTHIQDHVRKLQQLVGPGAKTQQNKGNENSLRQGISQIGGSQETEAELNGNPMGPVN